MLAEGATSASNKSSITVCRPVLSTLLVLTLSVHRISYDIGTFSIPISQMEKESLRDVPGEAVTKAEAQT